MFFLLIVLCFSIIKDLDNQIRYHLYKQDQEYHRYRINCRISHAWGWAVCHGIRGGKPRGTGHTAGDCSDYDREMLILKK